MSSESVLVLNPPAKINWTMEVLGALGDGYHEVRTILQTVAIRDRLSLQSASSEVLLTLSGRTAGLEGEPNEENLAYRAATLLRDRTGSTAGVRMQLEKRIPAAAGLGGGSSDAAAVLLGLRRLWRLDVSDEDLAALGAELGADVPFFVWGGTALASGRGDALAPLPDCPTQHLIVAWWDTPLMPDKTSRMYAALEPDHYTDGSHTGRLAERIQSGERVREDDLHNVFEAALPEVAPERATAFQRAAGVGLGRPHLCGSGPALFLMLEPDQPSGQAIQALEKLGMRATQTRTLAAAEAGAVEEGA